MLGNTSPFGNCFIISLFHTAIVPELLCVNLLPSPKEGQKTSCLSLQGFLHLRPVAVEHSTMDRLQS